MHYSFLSIFVDVDDKVEALDDDVDNNDKDKYEKANMKKNINIVCGDSFFCRKGGEGSICAKIVGLWIFWQCGRLGRSK